MDVKNTPPEIKDLESAPGTTRHIAYLLVDLIEFLKFQEPKYSLGDPDMKRIIMAQQVLALGALYSRMVSGASTEDRALIEKDVQTISNLLTG